MSTLWGIDSLVKLYNAINARLNNDPNEFWRISKIKADIRKYRYPEYYNTTSPIAHEPWDGQRWRQKITLGRQFGPDGRLSPSDFITFVRFSTHDGKPIARVPISIISLLETIAVALEMDIELSLLESLDEDTKIIERSIINKKYLNRLYNGELCEYSVCAHLLANHKNIENAYLAYQRAATLATCCLNLPEVAFEQIRIPDSILAGIEPLADYFRASHDRAAAFHIIASQASNDDTITNEKWLVETLSACGLPQPSDLHQMSQQQLSMMGIPLDGPESSRLTRLLIQGMKLRERRGPCGKLNFLDYVAKYGYDDLPLCLLGDDSLLGFGPIVADEIIQEHDKWFHAAYHYDLLLDEFLGACLLS